MNADELRLEQFYKKSSSVNQGVPQENMISIPAAAMGMLRQELLETIGLERTKGFLLRYGWHSGTYDAEKVAELSWKNKRDMLMAGPKMHAMHGYFEDYKIIKAEIDLKKETVYHETIWINSYEAAEHIKKFGSSDEPVCHTLTGYASGYLSKTLGEKVIAKEIKCKAMGYEHCHVVCRTIEEWDGTIEQELEYYNEESIIDELNETVRNLKIERDNLSKAYDVHHKLVEELLKENNLFGVANTLYKHTHLPVLIESKNLEVLAAAGTSEEKGNCYSRQLSQSMNKKRKKDFKQITRATLLNDFGDYSRLITPIYLQKEIVAYCSFLYQDSKPQEVDKLILEQGALASSLYLFNERTRIQTELRMQGNLLDHILSNQMTFEEISTKAYYVGFQLIPPYFMIAICPNREKLTIIDELEFSDRLINVISQFLKDRKMNALLGKKSGKMIIFLSEDITLKSQNSKNKFCHSMHDYLTKKYPSQDFKFGISSSSSKIEEASQLYDESNSALQMANHLQKVVFYELLGIEGIIFQTENDRLQKFAKRKLGSLLEEDKKKDMELTKTLYHYLNNGSNINKTAKAMNFSITGLRYRLQKINELLEVDLNIPDISHQIYLSLKLLIYWGELEIDVKPSIYMSDEDRFNDS